MTRDTFGRCFACGRTRSETCCPSCHRVAQPLTVSVPTDLRQQRKALGLTAEDVAGRVGVSPATIWNWEAGRHTPMRTRQMDRYKRLLEAS